MKTGQIEPDLNGAVEALPRSARIVPAVKIQEKTADREETVLLDAGGAVPQSAKKDPAAEVCARRTNPRKTNPGGDPEAGLRDQQIHLFLPMAERKTASDLVVRNVPLDVLAIIPDRPIDLRPQTGRATDSEEGPRNVPYDVPSRMM